MADKGPKTQRKDGIPLSELPETWLNALISGAQALEQRGSAEEREHARQQRVAVEEELKRRKNQ